MTYLYDVINTSHRGMWVAAEDKVDAAIISHDLKHTHKIENAQVEGPIPVKDSGLQAMLDANRRGHLGIVNYELPKISFMEILFGQKKSNSGKWFFIKEYPCANPANS